MAGEARVIRAPHYIDLLERGRAAERADSIRSVSEVEEVVCVCEGNRSKAQVIGNLNGSSHSAI
eukprot:COSAG02_NODE_1088_length_14670_cov_237.088326_1_plen_64_part_00